MSPEAVMHHTQASVIRRAGGALLSLAGAVGIAVLLPATILAIGIPVALLARAIGEAIGWLLM